MRFTVTYRQPTIFTEIMTKQDKIYFDSAFRVHDPKNKLDKRLPLDREWVDDVLTSWSEKCGIPKSLAVTVFTTGQYHAVQRHYVRYLMPKLVERRTQIMSIKDEGIRAFQLQQHEKIAEGVELVCKWDDADLANWCRSTFIDALGISHPSIRFDAHTKRVKEKRESVKNPMTPKVEHVARGKRKDSKQSKSKPNNMHANAA